MISKTRLDTAKSIHKKMLHNKTIGSIMGLSLCGIQVGCSQANSHLWIQGNSNTITKISLNKRSTPNLCLPPGPAMIKPIVPPPILPKPKLPKLIIEDIYKQANSTTLTQSGAIPPPPPPPPPGWLTPTVKNTKLTKQINAKPQTISGDQLQAEFNAELNKRLAERRQEANIIDVNEDKNTIQIDDLLPVAPSIAQPFQEPQDNPTDIGSPVRPTVPLTPLPPPPPPPVDLLKSTGGLLSRSKSKRGNEQVTTEQSNKKLKEAMNAKGIDIAAALDNSPMFQKQKQAVGS